MRSVKRKVAVLKLNDGCDCLLDPEDFEAWKHVAWRCEKAHGGKRSDRGPTGYPPMRGRQSLARLLMGAPARMQVDHINHDVNDNRKANLRMGS